MTSNRFESRGAIHSNKISGNFGLKLNGGSVQPEKFRKNLSRWATLLGWTGPIQMDRSIWPFRAGHSNSQSQYLAVRYLPFTKWRKILITALLWIVNSWSIGVTRTSMYSYNRSVVASQAKCMFWLLTALKDDLFPERICNFFSSFDSKTPNEVFEVTWQISGNGLLKITRYTG